MVDGQPEAKKQKVQSEDLAQSATSKTGDKSEDDWEEVDRAEGGPSERLEDEPVEVAQGPSAADVRSVQSSGILDEPVNHASENMLAKDW